MVNKGNFAELIRSSLPSELIEFMQQAGNVAARFDQKLYLVGGVVRDILLKRKNFDLDLVAEGDAIKLAEEMARLKNGKVIAHSRFSTAKIRWEKWSVDIAAARSEGYQTPGALPDVKPADIEKDLCRRDFTINAMAVKLTPLHYGELIDLFGGREDLQHKVIRILHSDSFKDDATRMWRAVRYEQRLDFAIEEQTLELVRRDLNYLDTISGTRIWHELELCMEEEKPEKVLLRASELGILGRSRPSLYADQWLSKKITRARNLMQPYSLPEELYMALLIYRIAPADLNTMIDYLKLPRGLIMVLKDTLELKNKLATLSKEDLLHSEIYRCLHNYTDLAILANLIACESAEARQNIGLYIKSLRHVRTSLTGSDLVKLNLASGPRIKEILEILREARLDGKVSTREEELDLAKAFYIERTGRQAGE